MFGRKKTDKLIQDIDRYFDLMDQQLLVFKEGVRNYLYDGQQAFNQKLSSMAELQAEIEVLRRSLENSLYTQTVLERSSADIMRLFEKTRTHNRHPQRFPDPVRD